MKANKILITFLCAVCLFLFFANVENTTLYVIEALKFCFLNIIPTLLPFMIITATFLYSRAFPNAFSKISDIFGVCRKYFPTILLSSLCGFIVGPKIICEDEDVNLLSKDEFSSSVAISSNAGIGFVVGCVGGRIWGNIFFGISLFIFQILSSFFLNKLFFKRKISSPLGNENQYLKTTASISSFSKGVSSSISSLALICTYTIFFSTLLNSFFLFLKIEASSLIYKIVFIFTEFCQGSFQTILFENILIRAFFSGFCVGFGGLCVHFQTFAVCESIGKLNKKKFFAFKFLHGVMCGFFALMFFFLFI